MGFFSWKTQDTNRSISNCYSGKQTFTVYMHDHLGNIWECNDYGGYGLFGGKDFYVLLAEMNGLGKNRDLGIDLWYSDNPFISPNLTEDKSWKYVDQRPKECPDQGYFYEA
jgi:hypothetical protein